LSSEELIPLSSEMMEGLLFMTLLKGESLMYVVILWKMVDWISIMNIKTRTNIKELPTVLLLRMGILKYENRVNIFLRGELKWMHGVNLY
jgi:hypothetical protein